MGFMKLFYLVLACVNVFGSGNNGSGTSSVPWINEENKENEDPVLTAILISILAELNN